MKYSPVANTLKLIGGKWKIMILDSLLSKHMRFGELKRSLNGITSQMLSKQLKDMERDKLLIKKISKVETLNTEYSLTEFGKSTIPIVKSLIKWGTFNKKKITKGTIPAFNNLIFSIKGISLSLSGSIGPRFGCNLHLI